MIFHRTTGSAWKNILKEGLKPGGQQSKGRSDRVHVYFSDKALDDMEYRSGVRPKHNIEVTVSLTSAIEDGGVFFRTASDAILTPFAVGPKHILSVVDTDKSEVRSPRRPRPPSLASPKHKHHPCYTPLRRSHQHSRS